MSGIPRDYPAGLNESPQVIRRMAAGEGAAECRKDAVGPNPPERAPNPQQLATENARMRGQILEAIAILQSGTDYEKMHVVSILESGVR